MCGLAVHVRAHVEQYAGIAFGGGHRRRQRGTVNAGQRAQHHLGRSHCRSSIAGSDKSGGLALTHQLEADAHGAVFFGADGLRCLLLHADTFRGMVDDDRQVFVVEQFIELIAQLRLWPNQVDPHGQSAAGEDGPANLRLWCFIGADGVEHDVDEHGCPELADCFLYVENGAALVLAALGAGVVGELLLVAVGALADADGGQKVV